MNICVFCGSSPGIDPVYIRSAISLADNLSERHCTLVYGGGNVGLMGIIADRMLANNAKVIGVIPRFLMDREVGHTGITSLEVVASMHERKKRMADLAHVFIALPGGLGTLEELSEIMTWKQLGLINVPVGLLNVNAFFDPLLNQMKTMVEEGFMKHENFEALKTSPLPQNLLTLLGVVAS